MSVINTNFLALVSQNNLYRSQGALGSAIERLSSGMRINSAKDDAAGQAIANRFTANIRGLTQAARNANDGISIAQTTEGSLNEVNENLQRIREQVVQALNGSNSGSDLRSIQNEIDERMSEIDRISAETQFNGKYVLGTDGAALTIQVGANDNEQITINLERIDSMVLGLQGFSVASFSADPNLVDVANGPMTAVELPETMMSAPAVTAGAVALSASATIGPMMTSAGGTYYAEVAGDAVSANNGWYEVALASDGTAAELVGGPLATAGAPDPGTLVAVPGVPGSVSVGAGAVALDQGTIGALMESGGGTMYAEVTGSANAANNGWYEVTQTSGGDYQLTGAALGAGVDTSTLIAIPTGPAVQVSIAAGGTGVTDGVVGPLMASAGGTMYAEVTGDTNAALNGWYAVVSDGSDGFQLDGAALNNTVETAGLAVVSNVAISLAVGAGAVVLDQGTIGALMESANGTMYAEVTGSLNAANNGWYAVVASQGAYRLDGTSMDGFDAGAMGAVPDATIPAVIGAGATGVTDGEFGALMESTGGGLYVQVTGDVNPNNDGWYAVNQSGAGTLTLDGNAPLGTVEDINGLGLQVASTVAMNAPSVTDDGSIGLVDGTIGDLHVSGNGTYYAEVTGNNDNNALDGWYTVNVTSAGVATLDTNVGAGQPAGTSLAATIDITAGTVAAGMTGFDAGNIGALQVSTNGSYYAEVNGEGAADGLYRVAVGPTGVAGLGMGDKVIDSGDFTPSPDGTMDVPVLPNAGVTGASVNNFTMHTDGTGNYYAQVAGDANVADGWYEMTMSGGGTTLTLTSNAMMDVGGFQAVVAQPLAPTISAGATGISVSNFGPVQTDGGGNYYAEVTGAGSAADGWYAMTASGGGTTFTITGSPLVDVDGLQPDPNGTVPGPVPTVGSGAVNIGAGTIGGLMVASGGSLYAEVTGAGSGVDGWYAVMPSGGATTFIIDGGPLMDVGNLAAVPAGAPQAPVVGSGGVNVGAGSIGALMTTSGGAFYAEVTGAGSGVDGWYAVQASNGGTTFALDGGRLASQGIAPAAFTAVSTVEGTLTVNVSASENIFAYTGTGANDPAYVIASGTGAETKYYTADISAGGTVTRGTGMTENPLAALDAALQRVDDLRSHLGAIQNRFESTVSNLNNTINNLSAARSRIEDADYAVEVSNMTRAQILQQAGTSVLAQANQIPQTVLSLLR